MLFDIAEDHDLKWRQLNEAQKVSPLLLYSKYHAARKQAMPLTRNPLSPTDLGALASSQESRSTPE